MEYFSQNLKNEEDLVCVLGRAGKMPRERTSAKHLRQNGTTEPEQRLRDAAVVVLLLRDPPVCSSVLLRATALLKGVQRASENLAWWCLPFYRLIWHARYLSL